MTFNVSSKKNWTFCHYLLTLMLFQTDKTCVHLKNINEIIFDDMLEISV